MSAKRNRHFVKEYQRAAPSMHSENKFRVIPKKKFLIFVSATLIVTLVALLSSAPPPAPPGNPFANKSQQANKLSPIDLRSPLPVGVNISPAVLGGSSFDAGGMPNLFHN